MHVDGAMKYTLFLMTAENKVISAIADYAGEIDGAPFGMVPYRLRGTCELEVIDRSAFWDCVDAVLTANTMTPEDYSRIIKAVDENGVPHGEVGFDENDPRWQ